MRLKSCKIDATTDCSSLFPADIMLRVFACVQQSLCILTSALVHKGHCTGHQTCLFTETKQEPPGCWAMPAHQLLFEEAGLRIGAVQDGHVLPLMPALLVKLLHDGHHTLCFCPFIGHLFHLLHQYLTCCHSLHSAIHCVLNMRQCTDATEPTWHTLSKRFLQPNSCACAIMMGISQKDPCRGAHQLSAISIWQ